ncbi:hypothetical protein EV421DRAFT_1903294 [Armillaria borealis]|uniref:Uncharacterized protein n=1 Tax=Armillaria borealis TaxID=47425 RepID=A0AA39JLL5_9AGAR|nr:hypothetical protein EV421DRAFT_1903294 [Armillaria borealis]
MSGDSNIGAWIQFAKLTVAAGEMAPFPYIKGVAGCIATILEIVELAGKNNEDLQDLAESIGTTIRIIKETVEAHGDTSATHFRDVCVELQKYLESLIAELNTTRRKLKSKRITRFLTTKKVSGVIDGYKQRVNDIKADYLVLVTTDSRLAMSEMQDALSATVTQATETAQSHITSTVKSQAHDIRGEIRSLGDNQREHAVQICEKLQDMKGYYKGQVRELFPGDIYIENLVSPSRPYSALQYQDRYCTVKGSSRAKIIRMYQHSPDKEEAILKTADALINIKHPNIEQVFGICRSPNFPAIIFHGSTQIPYDDYTSNLTAKQIIPFYIQLYYDLESLSEYLSRHVLHCPGCMADEHNVHLNEHGQIVMMVAAAYQIGPFFMWSPTEESLPSKIDRWSSLLTLQKDSLCNAYDAIKHITAFRVLQGTLVGRVPIMLDKWVVKWPCDITMISFPLTHNGSITVPLLYVSTESFSVVICLHSSPFDEILDSWIAQGSQLQSCIRSRGHVDDDELCIINTEFYLTVMPKVWDYDPFCLCDTFMAKDHTTLSVSITTPSIDYQTNKLSWPVFTWYDGDSEISSVEVEEVFSVYVDREGCQWKPHMSQTLLTTIPELNTDYGFDPACSGADVCEYFGWPFMEILNVSMRDWMPLHGSISESASVILDNRYWTSSESTISPLENAPEGEHTNEILTKTQITAPV